MSAFDELVGAIERHTGRAGRRRGSTVRLLCPAHDDHEPSLDVTEGSSGRPLVQCRSHGCSYAEVLAAVGLEPGDLDTAPAAVWTPFGDAVAVYDYTDEAERLLYQVCRTADKQFPQRAPDPAAPRGWRWKLDGVRRVLYQLPRVVDAARIGEHVWVCEGEKDVHALLAAGAITATCNPGGAGKWRDEYSEQLVGATCTVVADRDDAGLEHARGVHASLARHGVSARVVLPAEGKDAADHVAGGHGLDAFEPLGEPAADELAPVFTDAYAFARAAVPMPEPLWGTRELTLLAAGGLALLAGRPGSGKTTLLLDLACHLASGQPYPHVDLGANGHAPEAWPVPRPLRVALVENEGPQELFRVKLRDKLAAHGSDLGEGGGCLLVQTWRWGTYSLRDPEVFERTLAELDEQHIDIVLGDPLASMGLEGVGSPAETFAFVQILRRLGLGLSRAFLFLHHFRERVERTEDELARISGAWGGHLDTLLTLAATESADQARLAFPKLRWATTEPPAAVILGRVRRTASFEAIATEGDPVLLEPDLAGELQRRRDSDEARHGWSTASDLATAIGRHRKSVGKSLESAPHLFTLRTGAAAKALGARPNAKLWGLAAWADEHPAGDEFEDLF